MNPSFPGSISLVKRKMKFNGDEFSYNESYIQIDASYLKCSGLVDSQEADILLQKFKASEKSNWSMLNEGLETEEEDNLELTTTSTVETSESETPNLPAKVLCKKRKHTHSTMDQMDVEGKEMKKEEDNMEH